VSSEIVDTSARTVNLPAPTDASNPVLKPSGRLDGAQPGGAAPGVTPGVDVPDAEPGDPVSARYAVVEEIGRGGMGRVLEARDEALLREVAMKVMRSRKRVDADRFTVEAQITGQLDHPNVLPVYDYGVDDEGNPYFTMKLVRGHTSLAELIDELREGGPRVRQWTFRKRVMLIQEVCRALHYAHVRGVLHRDVKPDNIVIGAYGEVYLVDWGVATLSTQAQIRPVEIHDEQRRSLAESEARMIVGTPVYMSPEQIKGDAIDARSDVYSLVAVLYELLTLHHYLAPIPEGVDELRARVTKGKRTAAERYTCPVGGRVPRNLSVICLRGLSVDPTKRFADAKDLEDTLQRWLEGKNEVLCPGTCMQRGMNESRNLIDQYPVAVPAALITAGVLGSAWVLYASYVALTVT